MNPLQLLTPRQLAIGSGMLYPIQLQDKELDVYDTNTHQWVKRKLRGWYPDDFGNPELINQNLRSVLLYQLGFRLREEDFGNSLEACLEEPNTQVLRFFIEYHIRQILLKYESRITFSGIKTSILKPGSIYVRVKYKVKMDTPLDFYLDFGISNL